jgi:hypothetical protein
MIHMSRRFATLATLSMLAWVLTAAPAQAAEQQYYCNQVLGANTPNIQLLAGLLGIIPPGAGFVGLNCLEARAESHDKLYCGGTDFAGLIITGGRPGTCPAAATTKSKAIRKATAKRRARG